MSQFCPHCGQGFKRLASHEWRCKHKSGASSQSLSYASSPGHFASSGRPSSGSSRGSSFQELFAQLSRPVPQTQTEVKQRCPDCGGTYKDLSKHKVCHKRGSGNYADKPRYVEMQVCPDCGKSFKNLANHKDCHARKSGVSAPVTNQFQIQSSGRTRAPPNLGHYTETMYGISNTAQYVRPATQTGTEAKQRCPDCGGTYKDISKHKVCHKKGSGKYADKPRYVEMQVCPDCGNSFKNLADHKVCHGWRNNPSRRPDDRSRWTNSVGWQTPPPSPRSYDEASYSPPSYSILDPYTNPVSTVQQPLGWETPPPTPPYEPESEDSVVEEDEEQELVLPICQPRQQQRPRPRPRPRPRHGQPAVHNVDFDEALATAMAASLDQQEQTTRGTSNSLEFNTDRVVEAHLVRCVNSNTYRCIEVDRENVWKSSLSFFKDVSVSNTDRHLMVVFTDSEGTREEAVDAGGPRREYLRLLCDAIVRDSGMLHGDKEIGMLLRPSTSKYMKNQFKVLGIMLATIIAQRGQPPAIFAPPVVDAILNDDPDPSMNHIPIKYVPQSDVRRSLHEVCEADTAEQLEEALSGCEWRYDLDGVPARVTLDNKDEFVTMCVHYYVLLNSRPMLDQMILDLIRNRKLRYLLEYDSVMTMTSEKIMNLLVPRFTSGSNDELKIVSNIRNFLEATENGTLRETLQERYRLSRAQVAFADSLKPESLLRFVTGCCREPAGGFSPLPAIVFQHSDTWRLPHVSTCSNELYITVHHRAIRPNSLAITLLTSMMNSETFTRA